MRYIIGLRPGRIKLKTIKLVFVAHGTYEWVREKTGWHRIRIMCHYKNQKSVCCSSTMWTSSSSHFLAMICLKNCSFGVKQQSLTQQVYTTGIYIIQKLHWSRKGKITLEIFKGEIIKIFYKFFAILIFLRFKEKSFKNKRNTWVLARTNWEDETSCQSSWRC